jgi:general secretion pathway protein I
MSAWNNTTASPNPGTAHNNGSSSATQKGFTLLEVMIAICLLGIALPTLFSSQSQSVALGTTTIFNTQAPLLAQQKLAELASDPQRSTASSGEFGDDFPGFQWKLETEDANLGDSEILRKLENTFQRLTLTVSWGNDHYTYQIQSYEFKDQTP